jgi:hypothetical protein
VACRVGKRVLQRIARLFGNNLQHGKRDIAADHRRHLEKSLVFRAQPVDPGSEDGLDGRRNAQRVRLSDKGVRPALARECPALDERAHALFQKERVALGSFQQQGRRGACVGSTPSIASRSSTALCSRKGWIPSSRCHGFPMPGRHERNPVDS